MKQPILTMLFFIVGFAAFAQEDEKITMERIKQECEALPNEKRVRLRVSHFEIATGRNDALTITLNDNLTAMLTNALQGVNCYRVLESANEHNDQINEIDKGDSSNKYSNKKTALKVGRQENAQIIVKGQLVEYSVQEKGFSYGGLGSHKKVVKIAINIKMVNPETEDVIASKIIRAETKAGNSFDYGWLHTTNSDPAITAVAGDCINKGVQFMARLRDSLHLTADGMFNGATADTDTQIDLSNINYSAYTAFANLLSTMPGYKSMDKSFSGTSGTYTVTHTGSTDSFMDELGKKIENKYDVLGVSGNNITLKAK